MKPDDHSPFNQANIRILIIGAVMLTCLTVLWGRCYFLQVQQGKNYLESIDQQSLRSIRIPSRRGKIISSDNVILADNEPVFELVFYPEEIRFNRRRKTVDYMLAAAEKLAAETGRIQPLSREDILRHLNMRPGLPLAVLSNLSEYETARLFEKLREWRGADITLGVSRIYPLGRTACHLIGSTRKDNSREASDSRDFSYYIPDLTGRDGLEKFADIEIDGVPGLRGRPGYSLIQVDNLGYKRHTIIKKIEPVHGNNIELTVNVRAQKICENLLAYSRGAMVVVDSDNGDIIAAASSPGFNLKYFSPMLPKQYYSALLNDPGKPLLNRAFQGSYTPGSILKPLVTLGFCQSGEVSADSVGFCDGYSEIGNTTVRCAAYRRGGHGEVNLTSALRWSCNGYMIEHILKTGNDPVRNILRQAGIGRKTGIELPESAGVFPSDSEKKRVFGNRWSNYDSALLSIGQGLISITPLQAALYTAALFNGGTVYQPHLINKVIDQFGNTLWTRPIQENCRLEVAPEHLALIRQGMYEVVNNHDGSGRKAAVAGLEIYGKTGSAEVGVRPNIRINAWFIAHVSHNGRNYAIAILQENAASGGSSCAPLAREFCRKYLLQER